jgi:hypothetical protein
VASGFPGGEFGLPCALILRRLELGSADKAKLNEILRSTASLPIPAAPADDLLLLTASLVAVSVSRREGQLADHVEAPASASRPLPAGNTVIVRTELGRARRGRPAAIPILFPPTATRCCGSWRRAAWASPLT